MPSQDSGVLRSSVQTRQPGRFPCKDGEVGRELHPAAAQRCLCAPRVSTAAVSHQRVCGQGPLCLRCLPRRHRSPSALGLSGYKYRRVVRSGRAKA